MGGVEKEMSRALSAVEVERHQVYGFPKSLLFGTPVASWVDKPTPLPTKQVLPPHSKTERVARRAARSRFDEFLGTTSGRLTVIALHSYQGGSTVWLCKCSCGKMAKVRKDNIKSGQTRSCGCLARARKRTPLGQTWLPGFQRAASESDPAAAADDACDRTQPIAC
jgi:hypothetical protein